ncbi:MAG: hypothetical protein IJR17_06955 [Clostridia bacterium]|nr:hypothetical protein [Clostridia bacterium]
MSLRDKRIISTSCLQSKPIEYAAGAYIELTAGQYIELPQGNISTNREFDL